MTVIKRIIEIGQGMAQCPNRCEGIINDPASGTVPRCLFYDINSPIIRTGRGLFVVGKQPRTTLDQEKKYYIKHKTPGDSIPYEVQMDYWNTERKSPAVFYQHLDKMIGILRNISTTDAKQALDGPVVWSDVVKCERAKGVTTLQETTRTTCSSKYLAQELAAIPVNWPIIAVGRDAYDTISRLTVREKNRTLIGVPTARFDRLQRLIDIFTQTSTETPPASWLPLYKALQGHQVFRAWVHVPRDSNNPITFR